MNCYNNMQCSYSFLVSFNVADGPSPSLTKMKNQRGKWNNVHSKFFFPPTDAQLDKSSVRSGSHVTWPTTHSVTQSDSGERYTHTLQGPYNNIRGHTAE